MKTITPDDPRWRHNKPSPEWLNRLILVIQEANSEIGKEFIDWLAYDVGDSVYKTNSELVSLLRGMYDS